MKKILATILALTMVLSLGAVAFADGSFAGDTEEPTGSDSQKVTVTVGEQKKTDQYKVDISWGSLSYTYNKAELTWNTTSHAWTESKEAGWQDGDTTNAPATIVTLTNHSSKQIKATFAWSAEPTEGAGLSGAFEAGTSNVDGSFAENAATVNSADLGGSNKEQKYDVQFKLSGTPTYEELNNTKVGTISVTLGTAA